MARSHEASEAGNAFTFRVDRIEASRPQHVWPGGVGVAQDGFGGATEHGGDVRSFRIAFIRRDP